MAETALLVLGGLASVAGTISESRSSAKAARFNQQTAEMNRQREIDVANIESKQFMEDRRRMLAKDATTRRASGVSLGTGSSLFVEDDAIRNMLEGAKNIRMAGGARSQMFGREANLEGRRAKTIGRSGFYSTGGTILSTGLKVAQANNMFKLG